MLPVAVAKDGLGIPRPLVRVADVNGDADGCPMTKVLSRPPANFRFLSAAARNYVEELGVPVFPCSDPYPKPRAFVGAGGFPASP